MTHFYICLRIVLKRVHLDPYPWRFLFACVGVHLCFCPCLSPRGPPSRCLGGLSNAATLAVASPVKSVKAFQASPWSQYATRTSASGDLSHANCFYFGFRYCCVAALGAVSCQNQTERRRRPCKLLLYRRSKLLRGTFLRRFESLKSLKTLKLKPSKPFKP